MIGFLIATSVPFAWVLIAEGLPQEMITWARSGDFGPFVLMLILVGVLFIAGTFLDLTPAMLIAAPLFLPLMISGGFDPIHLGIVMIIVLQLGGVTPPVGILVFITAQISRTAPMAVFREVIPSCSPSWPCWPLSPPSLRQRSPFGKSSGDDGDRPCGPPMSRAIGEMDRWPGSSRSANAC